MRQIILFTALCLTATTAIAQTVLERFESHNRPETGQMVYNNPVLKAWQHDNALSEAGADFDLRDENNAVDAQRGDRQRTLSLAASTYMKHKTSTLWGDASYRNSKTCNVQWNETSDYDIVAPYLLADPSIRDMKSEQYSFGGGYADCRRHLAWGARLNYSAGLYHRNIDPRPKNVTSRLQAAAGAGYIFADSTYVAALTVEFVKYKQTNDVTFYSEMGNERLFHLVGLNSDYARFAGTGYATYYTGRQCGLNTGLLPTGGRGFSADVNLTRLTFDNVLTALNKLPLARLARNTLYAETSWKSSTLDVTAHIMLSRTVGTENIFGDAAATVYPQIGSLDNYHRNEVTAGLTAVWRTHLRSTRLAVIPAIYYRHDNTIYAQPQSRQLINNITPALEMQLNRRSARFYWQINAGGSVTANVERQLLLGVTGDALQSLTEATGHTYRMLSSTHGNVMADARLAYAFNSRYALQLALSYSRDFYTASVHRNRYHVALTCLF